MYLQLQFLCLMQAIESFHRVTKGGKYLTDEEWKRYREEIESSISSELQAGHRASLKKRVEYGNEFSLRKRIYELSGSLIPDTLSGLCLSSREYIDAIVDTRNYLTHYDENLKDVSLKGVELFLACQRMRLFIAVLLMKELGIDETRILKSLKSIRRYNFVFKDSEAIK